jgi:GT2 family glycosyltransferase
VTLVEVVVPHQSRWDLLSRLIDSLERQTVRPAICVVDNASTDDTLAELAKRPEIRVIANAENVGFGRAVNAGMRSSQADFVITLNNDMVAEPDFIESMVRELQSAPDLAVAAIQLGTGGRIDTVGVALDQSLCAYDVGFGLKPSELAQDQLVPLGPSGGAAGYRREVFLRFGGYDEHIFAYLEDADLALRMRADGITYRLATDAVVIHAHSATLGSGSKGKNRLMGWSRGYLLWKYGRQLPLTAKLRGAAIDGVVYLGQLVIDRNAGALQGRRQARAERPPGGQLSIELATNHLGLIAALKRRLGRR